MSSTKVFNFLVRINGINRLFSVETSEFKGKRVPFSQVYERLKKMVGFNIKSYSIRAWDPTFESHYEINEDSKVWVDDSTEFYLYYKSEPKQAETKFFKFLVDIKGIKQRVYFQTIEFNGKRVRFNNVLDQIKKIDKNINDFAKIEIYDRDFKEWVQLKDKLNVWVDNMAKIRINSKQKPEHKMLEQTDLGLDRLFG